MTGFAEALAEMGRRTEALNIVGDEEAIGTVFAEPTAIARRILSGYIETDDTDDAIRFLDQVAEAMVRMIRQSPSREVAMAGLRVTAAQILSLGVILERQEEDE